ncbi:protein DMR6-LIKE OXYGENASE 2-like [Prunus yedoensis var. nudiflora]|uniref:Protein DMR6-LIKE OXYGENASE 2-like n=1 Tax=Prunus yedoensis var. nudiflora TaxID=2094558 RepID=A0A314Y974_PRUYE|nr:protein DMR6-LIKE OXYGENASE 2-like [Prunus yedoensis var. nudiflora]
MQNDEVIWQVIRHKHCSFMSKIETGIFCRNPYNVSNFLFPHVPSVLHVFCSWREIGALAKRLLGLISQGLGPEEDCLQEKLGENPTQKAEGNYYPPCPDPELTLGLSVHTDLNALTILRQTEGVTGLQVLSNGRYKSVHHWAVTNKVEPRLSLAMFYGPSKDTVIGPIEDLIDAEHPPLYRSYKYAEFF